MPPPVPYPPRVLLPTREHAARLQKRGREYDEEEVLRECYLMKRCSGKHEGVITFMNLYETKKTFELVMEHCNVGEWLNTVRAPPVHRERSRAADLRLLLPQMILRSSERDDGAPYTEDEARPVLKLLLGAVACLHENQICHRDLKPENILIIRAPGADSDDVNLKIADFGLAADLVGTDGRMKEAYGSPQYAAPEIGSGDGYGTEVDEWSLGVVVFMMLSGVLPYEDDDPGALRRKVKNLSVEAVFRQTDDLWEIISKEGKDFVKSLLVKNGAGRIPCSTLLQSSFLEPNEVEDEPVEEGEPPESDADALRQGIQPVSGGLELESGNRDSFRSNKSGGTSSPRSARSAKRLGSMKGEVSYVGCDLPDDADVVVSVDIGTTGTKAVLTLIGRSHEELGSVYEKYESGTITGDSGVEVEQQPEDWWNAFVRATRRLLTETGVIGAEPRLSSVVICLSGQMQDMILVSDEHPEGVRPAILYSDSRARAQAAELEEKIGTEVLQNTTGNYKGATSCIAKWLWLQQEDGESLGKAEKILLGAHDYVAWRLSGVAVCDLTTASTTGLLDKASAATGYRWCTDLLAQAGIERTEELLPKLESAASVCGKMTEAIVDTLGLEWGAWADDSYIISGSGDIGATTVGAGGGVANVTYAYLGTSGWIAQTMTQQDAAAAPPPEGVFELLHPDPSLVIRAVSMLNSGGAVEWLVENEFMGSSYEPHEAYASIDTTARTSPAGSNGMIFLPYLSGERSPMSDPTARGVYFGMSRASGKAERFRSTLEGVAFSYKSLFAMLCACILHANHLPLLYDPYTDTLLASAQIPMAPTPPTSFWLEAVPTHPCGARSSLTFSTYPSRYGAASALWTSAHEATQ